MQPAAGGAPSRSTPAVPSTLQPPNVVNSLSHALALPPPRPPDPPQHQFIQPAAIYHNPPQHQPTAGSSSSSSYAAYPPPPAQTEPTTEDASGTQKRKRGRPKGSKTKNKRVQGVLIPLESVSPTQPTGSTATASSSHPPHALGEHGGPEEEDDLDPDESMDVDFDTTPPPPPPSSRPRQATYSGTADGPALGLGVGIGSTEPGPAPTIKDFYDFQWRVMSLCSVFYESAGDLVRSTDPEVLAQSFSLGNGRNPVTLLEQARDFCDVFLANPPQLARGPPPVPPVLFRREQPQQPFVPIPAAYPPPPPLLPPQDTSPRREQNSHHVQQYYPTPVSPIASAPNPYLSQPAPYNRPSTSASASAPPPPPTYHHPQPPPPSQPQVQPRPAVTASSLSGAITSTSSSSNPPLQSQPTPSPYIAPAPSASPAVAPPTYTTVQPQQGSTSTAPKAVPQSTHGAWSDEETERLKTLAEQSKRRTSNGEIDWDWTVDQFGTSRSRHQILIKATNLGLKPTSTHPSRLRKRLSMTNTQEQGSTSSSVPPTGGAHQVEPIPEAPDVSASNSQSSLGSSSPRQQHQLQHHHPSIHPPLTTISPSVSVASTPTLPHTDQLQSQQHVHYPGHNRRTSAGSFQASPAMPTSRAAPSPTLGHPPQHQQQAGGYMQPLAQHAPSQGGRSASYSYPQQHQRQQQQQQQSQMQAPRFPMSPQFQQQAQARSVSHSGAPSGSSQQQQPVTPQQQYAQQQQQYGHRPPQPSPSDQLALPRPPPPQQQQSHMPPPASMQRAQSFSQQQSQYSPTPTSEYGRPVPPSRPPSFGRSSQGGGHPSQQQQQQQPPPQQRQQHPSHIPHPQPHHPQNGNTYR